MTTVDNRFKFMEISDLLEVLREKSRCPSAPRGRAGKRKRSGKLACKPGSVGCPKAPMTAIHLGRRSPGGSSDLPGSSASSAIAPLFGLAPDGVCRAVRVATSAVSSYLAVSPLPVLAVPPTTRTRLCGLRPCHPAHYANETLRPSAAKSGPPAIGGLLSVALSIALRRPAVSRHPALRSPDFPLHANAYSGCPASFPRES
jgi:hypothetical protein